MPLLDQIKSPADVRKLSADQLAALAGEMRTVIFDSVSKNGGHLASNLGVVELTLALHHVYDFGPYPAGPDRLLWDVGHQCYPHKMLTGRAFEGLNNAGTLKRQLLIILNDNGMSISAPQGAFSQYLERVRVSTTYEEFKRTSEKLVSKLPSGVAHTIEHAWDALCA